jgi:hypothetical protein
MSFRKWRFVDSLETSAVDFITAQRARHLVEEGERNEQRLAQLAEQRSDSNAPDVRIRAWEKLHGLRLPSNPSHPVLELIARGTRLTLVQVQAEQRARRIQG